MKSILFILTFYLLSPKISAQLLPADTSRYYDFHINYLFNAHHFLWLEAFMNAEMDSTLVNRVLPESDLKIWNNAVDYYKNHLVKEDLRSSDYMSGFKSCVLAWNETTDSVPALYQHHVDVLKSVDPVYRQYFWPKHERICNKVLSDNIDLLRDIETDYVDRITGLTRQFWEFGKIRVDIVYVAKASKWNLRNRPYTSIFPTHVVMNAVGENQVPGNWIELLFHESAHHLILSDYYFVGGTIKDYAKSNNIVPPRQLWHVYLFYFTGQVAKKLLNENGVAYPITYMERNKVFYKYIPLLEKHLTPYLEGKSTLATSTALFIEEFQRQ